MFTSTRAQLSLQAEKTSQEGKDTVYCGVRLVGGLVSLYLLPETHSLKRTRFFTAGFKLRSQIHF